MKTLLALLVTVSAFSANALVSHYGKASKSGNKLTCSITNNTNNTLDLKYVAFSYTRLGAHGNDGQAQVRVDQRVRTGESYTASVTVPASHTVQYCSFQAR